MKRLLGLVAVAAAALWIIPAALAGTVTTVPQWNQSDYVFDYGLGATPTYGQTVVGNGQNLQSFTFYLNTEGGSVTARGGIGVWDGSEVTSMAWLDPTYQTVSSSTFQPVTFSPNVTLQSGQTYVLFATAYGDGGGCCAEWGAVLSGDPYPGGTYVYTNDYASTYATDLWDGLDGGYAPGADLAFSMQFGSPDLEITTLGYCSVAGDTWADGTPIPPGTFLNLETGQPSTDPNFVGATPAFYYQGVGLSCGELAGYTLSGDLVGPLGAGSDGLYPYLTKS